MDLGPLFSRFLAVILRVVRAKQDLHFDEITAENQTESFDMPPAHVRMHRRRACLSLQMWLSTLQTVLTFEVKLSLGRASLAGTGYLPVLILFFYREKTEFDGVAS